MAKGYAGYIMQEWRKLEKELLLDAYMKQNCKDDSEDLDLFEDIEFKEDEVTTINSVYSVQGQSDEFHIPALEGIKEQ